MKKIITALGFCLMATTVNATEFSCTMSKVSYIVALDPLVPALRQKFAEGNYAAIQDAEKVLEPFTLVIYRECMDITTQADLNKVIEALAKGTVEFDMLKDTQE